MSLSQIIPLHLVAGSPSPYGYFMAKALLENGTDPNSRDPAGLTPVHVAASWGNYETLKLLLLNGGNPWLEDDDGKTPLDLAVQEGRVECAELLSWWLKDAKAQSKSSTPTSAVQLHDHLFASRQHSPVIFASSSPTSSPSYKPKYFSSPLSASPTSQLSSGRRTPVSTTRFSPKHISSGRRVIRYDENGRIRDGNVDEKVGKSENSPLCQKFERLPSTPTSDRTQEQGNKRLTSEERKENQPENGDDAAVASVNLRWLNLNEIDQQKKDGQREEIGKSGELETINAHNDSSLLNNAFCSFSQQLDETLKLDDDKKKEVLAALEKTILEEDREIDPKRLSECNRLTDADLRRQALNQGMDVGPIVPSTRFLYVRRLACLLTAQKSAGAKNKYPQELHAAIEGSLDETKCRDDEEQLRSSFENLPNGVARQWREGCLKMSFCYLLLDPTVTRNLPSRASTMSDTEWMRTFVDAIFYIGKGKKSRPLQHLLDAACSTPTASSKNPKSAKIQSLWNQGYGVVSLHVFYNIIPVEAYTREAAMIEAIGLDQLCNVRRGDYYGAAANWALGRRRRFGAYLLKLAASIFLLEGEKQLKRDDVMKPSSG